MHSSRDSVAEHSQASTASQGSQVRSIWAIHDFVPDTDAYSSIEEYLRTPADEIKGGYSGCGWARVVMPLNELARHGWRVKMRHGRPPPESEPYRIIVAQRTDKYAALPDWRRLRLRHRLVYEVDDDVFSVDPVNTQAYVIYNRPEVQDAVRHAAEVADLVTVSTEPLREVMEKATGRDVHVLPNCIPAALLNMQRSRDRRHCIVGWCGGASHGADIAMIAEPLSKLIDSNKQVRLHLVGVNYEKTIGRRCRFTSWVRAGPDLHYYEAYDFDVALAPLTGTVFDRSKSHIKALEAMALGIPVLASDCEPYRELVIDGVNGYLCRERDWERRLRELANDREAREEMGAKARETARAWTIEANWHRWADLYEELL